MCSVATALFGKWGVIAVISCVAYSLLGHSVKSIEFVYCVLANVRGSSLLDSLTGFNSFRICMQNTEHRAVGKNRFTLAWWKNWETFAIEKVLVCVSDSPFR